MAHLSIAKFARVAGVSRQAIYKHVRKGRFEMHRGKIDTEHAGVQRYLAQRATKPDGCSREPDDPEKEALKLRKLEAQCERLKLQNDEVAARLLPIDLILRGVLKPLEESDRKDVPELCRKVAKLLHAAVADGASHQEVEKLLREALSNFIKTRKQTIKEAIFNREPGESPFFD